MGGHQGPLPIIRTHYPSPNSISQNIIKMNCTKKVAWHLAHCYRLALSAVFCYLVLGP